MEHGYTATSVRAIAREVGVDHAMVNYYFGSKQALFGEVMHLELRPPAVVGRVLESGPTSSPAQLAERLLATLLTVWENPDARRPLVAMLEQSIGDPTIRASVAEFLSQELAGQISDYIGGPTASVRTAAVMSVLSGIVFSRYVMRIEPMASLAPAQLLRAAVPMIAMHLRRG